MGTSPLMALGIKAMAANYAALQATGHNIANANVNGYSRQEVGLATAEGQFTGAGFFGRGVDVQTVTRSHNEFLTREAAGAQSLKSMDGARLTQLRRLENLFQGGEAGLGYATGELFTALTDLSSHPGDLATRQVVLARAGDVAARFAATGQALDDVQAGVTADLKSSVATINSLAKGIADANQRIAALRGLGQPANDLLDERERLISRLSEQVKVSRVEAEDGSMALFIGGGQRLVLGTEAAQLRVLADPTDPSRSAVGMVDGGAVRRLDENALGGGAVAGLLAFQNQDLVEGRNLVGQLAASVGGALNEQQLRGLTLQLDSSGNPVAGLALFAMTAPQALPHASNAKDASGNALGSVALTITDPTALQAQEYTLSERVGSPSGWQITSVPGGVTEDVPATLEIHGMAIDVSSAQPGDRYLLQPVSRAANGMQATLSDPRDLAAASPLMATTAAANTGTASVSGLTVTTSPLPYPLATDVDTLTFGPSVGGVKAFSYTSSLTGVTTDWNPGEAIVGGNGYTLQVSGVPVNGDTLTVSPTPASALAANNGNALSLLGLRDATITDGHTASDAWALALSDIGVRAQSAQSASDLSSAVADQAEQSRSSQAGVNLDEEAARLIQYQQSYQAAAKVLQVAQALFDTLLQATAR